jgi:hypothetical protein
MESTMDAKNDPQNRRAPRYEPEMGGHGPSFAEPEPPVMDLSAEVVATIERSPGERVTCRRIVGSNYRCNWWAAQCTGGYDNPTMSGLTVTTHRVVKSRMLRITKPGDTLIIQAIG